MTLNDDYLTTLLALFKLTTPGEHYVPFAAITHWTVEQRVTGVLSGKAHVRRCCRYLAKRGLAEYARGLWNDDGEPRGSGYAITYEGIAELKRRK